MKAVILAAGVGSRVRPLTDNKPKSLLPINGKTILERMIENISSAGIRDIIIVTGYLEDQIKKFALENFPNLNINFVRNDKYLETNTAYSLLLARPFIGESEFIKFDADVVFEKEVLKRLIDSKYSTALCIDKNIHLDKEEVKVITDSQDMVEEVGKKLDPHKSKGESIGIEKIGTNASKLLFEQLKTLLKDKKNWNEYYDDSYTTLVEKGVTFGAVDITGLKWVEIDTHQDYEDALKIFTN